MYWGRASWLRREGFVGGRVGLDDGLVMDDELENQGGIEVEDR